MNPIALRLALARLTGSIALLLLSISAIALGADSPWHRSVGGLDIYIGVVPAQLVQGHDAEHGGAKTARNSHHVVVAIFDSLSGRRVENATVSARVGELGLSTQQKRLETMRVAGVVSFGNYFAMRDGALYRIELQILRPGLHDPVSATFEYQHYQGS